MPDDPRHELLQLARSARAWVEWVHDSGLDVAPTETDLGGVLDALERGPAPPRRGAARSRGTSPARGRSGSPEPPRRAPPAPREEPRRAPAATPAPAPHGLPPEERRRRLEVLAGEVSGCTRCPLHEGRTQTVFARGNPSAKVVFVGEGPGFHEDQQGVPFVGKAGQLLDKMIGAMGLSPDEVYICNVVKCRPPDNRKPQADEVQACVGYLQQQLDLIQPDVIVALGATGVQGLLGTSTGIMRLRGTWKLYRGRIPIMPTFHPAFLLRRPERKRETWNDLKAVLERLGRKPPSRSKRGG